MLFERDTLLKGKNVTLKLFSEKNMGEYTRLLADPKNMEYLSIVSSNWPKEKIMETIELYQDRNRSDKGFCLTIVEKQTNEYVGLIELNRVDLYNKRSEIGMIINHEYWGKGFSREARYLVIDYAFSVLGLNRIEATSHAENKRSHENLKYFGFKLEGVIREGFYHNNQFVDDFIFGLLKSDWRKVKDKIRKHHL